jgi:hypothetical protein
MGGDVRRGRIEIEELTDAGDQVVAAVRGFGRMRGSDAEVDIRYGIVSWIRDGKIVQGRTPPAGTPSKPPGCRSRRSTVPPGPPSDCGKWIVPTLIA